MGGSNSKDVLGASGQIAKSIFDFKVSRGGSDVLLSQYSGKKAYIVVNVACQCGLTNQNYNELQELYEKYNSKGLEILAFPCNNFGGQEPGSNEQIAEFAKKKDATFPIFDKVECNNSDESLTDPLFQFLMNTVDGGLLGRGLKWNFHKFICDKDGVPKQRFWPITNPKSLEADLQKYLDLKDEI